MERERFLVRSSGDNPDGTRVGIAKLLELLGNDKNGVIVVPNLKTVKDTMLATVLGSDLSKQLVKNREITFTDGNKVELCSEQTLKNFKRADVYLVLWGTEYIVEDIESLPFWSSFVLVTWTPADAQRWVESQEVETIYDDDKG